MRDIIKISLAVLAFSILFVLFIAPGATSVYASAGGGGNSSNNSTTTSIPTTLTTSLNTTVSTTLSTSSTSSTSSTTTTIFTGPVATRTQGFWMTHTNFTGSVFGSLFGGSMQIGTAPHKGVLTSLGQVMGAFEAGISKTSIEAKRSSLDQARMQLLQQLVAAQLNCALACNATGLSLITSANSAYAGSNTVQILASASALNYYNNAGENLTFPKSGNATPLLSKTIASVSYWDTT